MYTAINCYLQLPNLYRYGEHDYPQISLIIQLPPSKRQTTIVNGGRVSTLKARSNFHLFEQFLRNIIVSCYEPERELIAIPIFLLLIRFCLQLFQHAILFIFVVVFEFLLPSD